MTRQREDIVLEAKRSNPTVSGRARGNRPGFTLIEISLSLLILGVLMGLLFVAFRSTRRYATSVDMRGAVSATRMGVIRFNDDFGFLPPLLRDQAATDPRTVFQNDAIEAAFSTYSFSLKTQDNTDLEILRPPTLAAPDPLNPFLDHRFSERSLAVYLAGVCEVPLKETDSALRLLPIDGVVGPGFFKPREDGGFDIPPSVRAGSSATSRRSGTTKFESLVELKSKSLSPLWFQRENNSGSPEPRDQEGDDVDANRERWVSLADAKRVPIRYYRWLNGAAYPQGSGWVYEIRTLDDYRVPPLVGRQVSLFPGTPPVKDIELNPELRKARWAIVSAGPDGAFGDERLDLLQFRLKVGTGGDERQLRVNAEKDNLVEVGE